jgi:HJR/Mrr/RecB family endonuclease
MGPVHTLDDLVGQTDLKDLLRPKIALAKAFGGALPHILFCGEREFGKLSFAAAVANELGVGFTLLRAGDPLTRLDLTGALSNLHRRDILAITYLDMLRPEALDVLTQAISTFKVRILVGVRPHTLPTPPFTFIGTTSKPWSVDERLRRWCIACQFAPYTLEQAAQIALQMGHARGLSLDEAVSSEIAAQCHLKPGEISVFLQRVANHLALGPSNRIDLASLHLINEFLGARNLRPAQLTVADELQAMGGLEFEHWVADLFTRAGFQVETTPATGDHGVDLWLTYYGGLIAVQCKRWDGSIGEPVIRDLYGAMTAARAQSACLVTTGSFTAQARQFCRDKPLHLIGLDCVIEAWGAPHLLANQLSPR